MAIFMQSDEVKNYAYYEKLGFGDYKLWSEKDLAQFLFLDYFNGMKMMGMEGIEGAFLKDQQYLINKYRKYGLLIKFLDAFFLKLYFTNKNRNKKTILFRTSQYSSIIKEAKKYYNVGLTAYGKKDRLFAFFNFIGCVSISNLTQYILYYLKDRKVEHLLRLVEETENKLKIAKPDYIVLRSDGPPLERAMVLASKKLGIITFTIQHGLEDSSCLFENEVSDFILLWGKYFKNLFLSSSKRKSEHIYILGLPYLIKGVGSAKEKNRRNICYLGQDLERYNKNFLQPKLKTLKSLDEVCKKIGLNLVYRPHPGDDRRLLQEKLPEVSFTAKNEKLEETFQSSEVFISFSSTSLVEAAMSQKIALQLMSFPVKSGNFEKLGICTKSFQTIKELENYLEKIVKAPDLKEFRIKFNSDYIETKYNPGQRFLEIMEKVENKKLL